MKKAYAIGINAAMLFAAIPLALQGVLLSNLIDHYSIEAASQGYIFTALNLGCLIAFLSAVWVSGRLGKASAVTLGASVLVVSLALLSRAFAFPVMLALYVALGFGLGLISSLCASVIADLYQGEAQSRMMCLLYAAMGIGSFITPLSARGLLDSGMDWTRVYVVFAVVGVALLAYLIVVSVRRQRGDMSTGTPSAFNREDLRAFFSSRSCILMLIIAALTGCLLITVSTWLNRYFDIALGNARLGSLALSLFWAGTTVTQVVLTFVRVPSLTYLRFTPLVTALCLAIGLISGNATVMCVMTVIASLAIGAIIPMVMITTCTAFQKNTLLATTLVYFVMYLAEMILPPIQGLISAANPGAQGLTLCIWVGVIALPLLSATAFGVKKQAA